MVCSIALSMMLFEKLICVTCVNACFDMYYSVQFTCVSGSNKGEAGRRLICMAALD